MDEPIFRECEVCDGAGEVPIADGQGNPAGYVDCQHCNGEGRVEWGNREDPLNVFDSYLIVEEIDSDEYSALTDTQKDGINLLLSCGRVDLNEGKVGRVRFWNWFGEESTTVANLTALLES